MVLDRWGRPRWLKIFLKALLLIMSIWMLGAGDNSIEFAKSNTLAIQEKQETFPAQRIQLVEGRQFHNFDDAFKHSKRIKGKTIENCFDFTTQKECYANPTGKFCDWNELTHKCYERSIG